MGKRAGLGLSHIVGARCMILFRHRLIFIHVHRTGGTSIQAACGQRDWHPDWTKEHAGWRIYKADFPDIWATFRKVSVHRDPETRKRSWFYFHKTLFTRSMDGTNYAPYACTYEEWLARGCPVHGDWSLCGILTTPLEQTEFTGPPEEGVKILRFENLAQEWRRFVTDNRLSMRFVHLPHLNANNPP